MLLWGRLPPLGASACGAIDVSGAPVKYIGTAPLLP
jgi:hypothetical protein